MDIFRFLRRRNTRHKLSQETDTANEVIRDRQQCKQLLERIDSLRTNLRNHNSVIDISTSIYYLSSDARSNNETHVATMILHCAHSCKKAVRGVSGNKKNDQNLVRARREVLNHLSILYDELWLLVEGAGPLPDDPGHQKGGDKTPGPPAIRPSKREQELLQQVQVLQQQLNTLEEQRTLQTITAENRSRDRDEELRRLHRDLQERQTESHNLQLEINQWRSRVSLLEIEKRNLCDASEARHALHNGRLMLPARLAPFVTGLLETLQRVQRNDLDWLSSTSGVQHLEQYVYVPAPSAGALMHESGGRVAHEILRDHLIRIVTLQSWVNEHLPEQIVVTMPTKQDRTSEIQVKTDE